MYRSVLWYQSPFIFSKRGLGLCRSRRLLMAVVNCSIFSACKAALFASMMDLRLTLSGARRLARGGCFGTRISDTGWYFS